MQKWRWKLLAICLASAILTHGCQAAKESKAFKTSTGAAALEDSALCQQDEQSDLSAINVRNNGYLDAILPYCGEPYPNKHLFIGVRLDDEARVKSALDSGDRVNSFDPVGNTPLHYAARLGNVKIMGLLVKAGANVNEKNMGLDTALHVAARMKNVDAIEFLMKKGAALDIQNVEGDTPIHSILDDVEDIRVSMKTLERATEALFTRRSILHRLRDRRHNQYVGLLNDDGHTPLISAVLKGRKEVAKMLLKHGASKSETNRNGEPLLSIAIKNGVKDDLLKLLLKKGYSPNQLDEEARSPLMVAAMTNNQQAAQLLVEHGAQINVISKEWMTALHYAAQRDHLDFAAFLLKVGALTEVKTTQGFTPVMLAAQAGNHRMVRYLLRHGAEVFPDPGNKSWILKLAIESGNDELVKYIYERYRFLFL